MNRNTLDDAENGDAEVTEPAQELGYEFEASGGAPPDSESGAPAGEGETPDADVSAEADGASADARHADGDAGDDGAVAAQATDAAMTAEDMAEATDDAVAAEETADAVAAGRTIETMENATASEETREADGSVGGRAKRSDKRAAKRAKKVATAEGDATTDVALEDDAAHGVASEVDAGADAPAEVAAQTDAEEELLVTDDDEQPSAAMGDAVQLELPNLDDIRVEEFVDPIEAIIFAAGEPVALGDIKKVLERTFANDHESVRAHKLSLAKDALKLLKKRWAVEAETRGFNLIEVADGYTFRSNPKWAHYLRSTNEQRPVRMSRPALETLAIIAYRQPATKPEIDHIRGVDCGATIRLLLDRNLVRIVGKRDEPGRPMLYGTTKEFLSFFNLPGLGQLPSLREFSELSEESQEEITQTLGPSLDDLSRNAKKLRLDEEPAVQQLDEAVMGLDATETKTRDAFASQGISIDPAAENPEAPVVPERETGT